MTLRDRPTKRVLAIRKVDGGIAIGITGTVHAPVKLKAKGAK